MSLSKKEPDDFSENIEAKSLLEKHENGLIDDTAFIVSFGREKVFYSTPFGDHKDGGSRLFALPSQDKTAYLPVFTSVEHTKEFYEKVGRCGFLIMTGSFKSFLERVREMNKGNTPIKLGAVIEPAYYGITVNANMLDAAIDLIN